MAYLRGKDLNTTSDKIQDHKISRQVRDLSRSKQSRFRREVETVPEDEGHNGEERILKRSDGNFDLVKRVGNKWIKSSSSLNGLEINEVDGVPNLEVVSNGKKFRLPFEEVK
jgi:hypothetical protein